MTFRRTTRIIIRLTGAVVLLIVLLVVASPLWVPWLVRPVVKDYGIQFAGYDRVGYARLVLRDVTYSTNNIEFAADYVEIPQPLSWGWNRLSGGSNAVHVQHWTVKVAEQVKAEKKPQASPQQIVRKVERSTGQLDRWLSHMTLTNGQVVVAGETINVPFATWDANRLSTTVESPRLKQSAELDLKLSENKPAHLTLSVLPIGATAEMQIATDPEQLTIDAVTRWKTNSAVLHAVFGPTGVLPTHATVKADQLRISAADLHLEGFQDVTGSFSGTWQDNRYAVNLTAHADPAKASMQPVDVELRATGTTNSVRIEELEATLPWITAQLSKNVELNYRGELLSDQAALNVSMDLSKQHVIKATGTFNGQTFLRRTGKRFPAADFQLTGNDFTGYGLSVRRMNLRGALDWPMLQLSSVRFELPQHGSAEASGRLNLSAERIEEARLELSGAVLQQFLPKNVTYTNLSLTAKLNGPFEEPLHSGEVHMTGLNLPHLTPLKLMATWRGEKLTLTEVHVEVTASNSTARLSGSADIATNRIDAVLQAFSLSSSNQQLLTLMDPAHVSAQKSTAQRWELALDALNLRGTNRNLTLMGGVVWPRKGKIDLTATNIHPRLVQDFFQMPLLDVTVDRLRASAFWTNGPLNFILQGQARFLPEAEAFSIQANAAGDHLGLSIEELRVDDASGTIVAARGFVPVAVNFDSKTNILRMRKDQSIDLRAETRSNSSFWNRVSENTGLTLERPHLNLVLGGTLDQPSGSLEAAADRIGWRPKTRRQKFPAITDFRARADFARDSLDVNEMMFLVEGEPVTAEAHFPLNIDTAQSWRKILDWKEGRGRLKIDDADFAPFVKFLPNVLAPQGNLSANISFAPGPKLDGWLRIENAATRPISYSGPLHDVSVMMKFAGQTITVETMHALLGGQPVALNGNIDFSQRSKDNLPLFDFRLQGVNVPIARRPEVILRGDLNLRASNVTNEIPLLGGEVHLRDSFYLGDIRQLIPGRVVSPKRRPPFFSVEAEPFDDWRVNVNVSGEDFLKVRSPLFRGSVSANWRITGTLREPIALGDSQIKSGLIQFPFANFRVTQGFITLTSEDPYRPQVFLTAKSRAFGYDLQMEVKGAADGPVIEFSSTPPLTSEEIILMVTAGEVPKRGFDISTERRAQRLALFVGKSVLSKLFGGEAGAERLSITTGEDISDQGRETYSLEYKITDDWSIVGEYDRFGALNAGLKWRVYSK